MYHTKWGIYFLRKKALDLFGREKLKQKKVLLYLGRFIERFNSLG